MLTRFYNRCNENNSPSVKEFRRQIAGIYLNKRFRKNNNKRTINKTDIFSHIQCSRYEICPEIAHNPKM
jgi:hypothetical protein